MYQPLRDACLRLLKAPSEPPEIPAGSHASVEIHRASPRFLTYRLLGIAFGVGLAGVAFGIALVVAILEEELATLLIVLLGAPLLLLVGLLGTFLVRIDYDLRYYVVTDRSLRVRQGAWTVREMTITYANVQNLRVEQGPLERLFGIWNVRVDTAGGGASQAQAGHGTRAHHVVLAGIENAHAVRDRLVEHLRARPAGTGLGDPDDPGRHEPAAPVVAPELLAALREVRDAAAGLRRAVSTA